MKKSKSVATPSTNKTAKGNEKAKNTNNSKNSNKSLKTTTTVAHQTLSTIPLVDNSACCIVPPKHLWHQIDTIRSQHDKSHGRWPPHLNLFFPFVPSNQFELVTQELTRRLSSVEPFTVELSQIMFNQDSKYLFVVPTVIDTSLSVQQNKQSKKLATRNPFFELIQQIMLALPQCKTAMTGKLPSNLQSWTPHMTLGQFAKDDIHTICSQLQSQWEPIQFEIREITLMSRTGRDDPFKVMSTIKLGS